MEAYIFKDVPLLCEQYLTLYGSYKGGACIITLLLHTVGAQCLTPDPVSAQNAEFQTSNGELCELREDARPYSEITLKT